MRPHRRHPSDNSNGKQPQASLLCQISLVREPRGHKSAHGADGASSGNHPEKRVVRRHRTDIALWKYVRPDFSVYDLAGGHFRDPELSRQSRAGFAAAGALANFTHDFIGQFCQPMALATRTRPGEANPVVISPSRDVFWAGPAPMAIATRRKSEFVGVTDVLSGRHNFKVTDPVVRFYPVDVVDLHPRRNGANVGFPHEAMDRGCAASLPRFNSKIIKTVSACSAWPQTKAIDRAPEPAPIADFIAGKADDYRPNLFVIHSRSIAQSENTPARYPQRLAA